MENNNSKINHYDVGIFGVWSGCNYGSVATYYALNQVVSSMGKSVLMIDKPILSERDVETEETHSRRFGREHYNISKHYHLDEMKELNELCDAFIIGSDQVWNYGISKNFGKAFYLDFAEEDKKKIAYAVSFGHAVDFAPEDERAIISKYMGRFDGISTREADGVRLCRECYGIKAEQVLDPVFLADPKVYEPLIEQSSCKEEEPFIVTYILDPTPEKREAILHLQKEFGGIKVINLLDGLPWLFEKNKNAMNLPNCIENLQVEDWLYYLKNAKFVLTDSCHGASFAVIFEKNFMAITNRRRGIARFNSLGKLLGIENRIFNDPLVAIASEIVHKPVDYESVNFIISSERKKSYEWLQRVLNAPKSELASVKTDEEKQIESLYANSEFKKIRILATLLRDYGVKHVVLCPGGRDVPLVRMFEFNEGTFTIHRVTDERSAAYYAMGIAAQLRKPVACVCTSGTAASNFLPAITEAYYTGVPLIAITADRRNVYLNHGEDQTIPQQHIFDGVIKKSITLSEAADYLAEYQVRRDISDCILETTHNNFGPVHINMAITDITIGSKVNRKHWSLLPKIYPHILRVGLNDKEEQLFKWVNVLKKSQRILLVYGQNPPLTEEQRRNISLFAEKYNCVIVTDFISNFDGEYTLKPYNMLQNISNADFNSELAPDVLITVGGKRLMNDPLTSKIRRGPVSVRHWSVNPDGKVKDFYFRLTSVIEMSQDSFFEWFAKNAGDIRNNGVYFNKWAKLTEKYNSPVIDKYTSNYVQSKFLPAIPSNSILHLGVGQSFYDCRKYVLSKDIEVFCNMGTNGIDGCTSTFLGQCSVVNDKKCFLMVGDLSFFYDMNSIWNKPLKKNIRIIMINNNGTGLLRNHRLKAISSVHNTEARGWVESTGFEYISARTKEELEEKLNYFVSDEPERAVFFEVFCD